MKRLSLRLLLAALFVASSAIASAQTAPAASEAPDQTQPSQAERHARLMAEMKAALKITPAQENLWNSYATALQPAAQPERPFMAGAAFDQLPASERIDALQKYRAERDAQIQQREAATKTFYAQLTPEQQQVFDAQMRRYQPHADWPGKHRDPRR